MVRNWLLGVLILVAAMAGVPLSAGAQAVLPRAGQSFSFGVIEGPYSNNDSTSEFQQTSLTLTVVSDYSGCGIITSPSGYTQDFSFAPGAATIINLPINLIQKADLGKTNKGLLVHTTAPVNLVLHDYVPYAGDATQILPDNALDTSYVTFGWGIWDDIGEDNLTEFLVTAGFDSTFVTITPSVRTLLGQTDSVPFIVMLNRGECYIDKADTSDHPIDPSLSGSIIHATKPVSVISGLTCAYVPVGVEACNELMDELVGKKWWGSHFFVQPLDIYDTSGEVVLTSDRDFFAKINNNTYTSFHHRLETEFSGPSEIHTFDSFNHPVFVEAHELTPSYSYGRGSGDPSLVSILDTSYYSDTVVWNTPAFDFPTQLVPIIFPTVDFTRATLDGKLFSQLGVLSSVINGSSYSAINPPVSSGLHQIVSPDPVFAISAGFFGADAYSFIAGTAGAKQPADSASHVLLLQVDSAATCSEFDVTASLGTPFLSTEGVITLTISITYDNSKLHLISVVPEAVLINASYTVDTSKPGTVTITVLGTPLITGSNLFQLVFEGWKSTAATTVALNSGATTICADDSETITSSPAIFSILPSNDSLRRQFLLFKSTAALCQPLTLSLNTDSIVAALDGLVISKIEVQFNPQTEQFENLILGNLLKNKSYTENTQTPGDYLFILTPPAAVAGGDSVVQMQFFPKLPNVSDTIHVRLYYLECGDTLTRNLAIGFAISSNRAFAAPLSLTFDSTVTCLSRDSTIYILDSSCQPLTLTSFSNSNSDWSVLSSNGLPLRFPNPVLGYSNLPVLIQFHPNLIGGEQDTVTFTYTYFDSTFTRTIALSGAGKASGTLQYDGALDFGIASLCSPVDSEITFINQSCDTAYIDSVSVIPPFMLLSKLPVKLLPGTNASLRVQYSPHAVTEDTGIAIATLSIHDSLVRDTLTFTGIGGSTGSVLYPRTFSFGNASICSPLDTQITFVNKSCDTATIDSVFVTPPFTLLSQLSLTLKAGASTGLLMQYAPDTAATDTGRAIVMLTVNGNPVTDTLTFTGNGKTTGSLQYARTLDFGTTSLCSRADSQIIFSNLTMCYQATVDSVSVAPPFALLSKLPLTIDTGTSAGLQMQYSPDSNSSDTGRAIISLTVNGIPVKDTLTFTGSGSGGGGANLRSTTRNDSIVFTRSECDPVDTVPFTLFNPGCNTLSFESGFSIIADSAGAWSIAANPTSKLDAGDSVNIALVTHDTLAGIYTGLFQTSYLDSNGVLRPLTLWIAETITPSAHTMALDTAPIDLGTMQPCQSRDTAIRYTNTSCVPVNAIGWTLSSWSSGFNVFGTGKYPPYPIHPDSSDSLHITFDGSSSGVIYDTVIVFFGTDGDSTRRIPLQTFVPAVDSVNFILSMPAKLSSGEHFSASVLPDRAVSGKGLTSISGVLSWNTDDFDFDSLRASSNLILANNNPYVANDNTRVAFAVSNASGITLDPAKPIAQLWLRADLTDTVNFRISLDSVLLNGSDTSFSQCTLATSGSGTTASPASLALACGDSLLIEEMGANGLVFMEDPQPNPATDQVTVHFRNSMEQPISYELIDALGKTRLRGVTGEDALTLDVSALTEGVYFLRAFAEGVSVSREILIVR